MKALQGEATATVAAPVEECAVMLAALDEYPSWYPEVVREVEVMERGDDGRPVKAHATLHVSRGPLVRDFDLLLAVSVEWPSRVKLLRLPHHPSDPERFEVTWRLENRGETHLHLRLDANLSVPRLLPLAGIGDALAAGFVNAAARALNDGRG